MKYQLNKLWFNVKFPNQLFKLEEKSSDFFTIFGGKMEVTCLFMKRKRIQERIQLKETLSLPTQEEADTTGQN